MYLYVLQALKQKLKLTRTAQLYFNNEMNSRIKKFQMKYLDIGNKICYIYNYPC